MKQRDYDHHKSSICPEFKIKCKRCSREYKRKDETLHDCVRHLQHCQKESEEKIEVQEGEISELKKMNNHLMMELSFMKCFLSKKFKLNLDEMHYGIKHKKMKILDHIKVGIGDICQSYLMSPLSFDIYFETRVSLPDIIWRVSFFECDKELEG